MLGWGICWRRIGYPCQYSWAFPCGSAGKESAYTAGDLGLIPGLGRSPGEKKGYPLQYSSLENSMDCIVHGVAKSWIRQRDLHFLSSLPPPAIYQTTVYLKQNKALFANLAKKPGSSGRTPFKYYQNKCGLYLIPNHSPPKKVRP